VYRDSQICRIFFKRIYLIQTLKYNMYFLFANTCSVFYLQEMSSHFVCSCLRCKSLSLFLFILVLNGWILALIINVKYVLIPNMQAYIYKNMESKISARFQTRSICCNNTQLCNVVILWNALCE
jgi:hypothetical protein